MDLSQRKRGRKSRVNPPKDSIFISYRREGTSDVAGRIYDRLCAYYGQEAVFKDVDNIPIGTNFKDYLSDRIKDCRIILVIIGKNWLSSGTPRRKSWIHDPNNFVHIEIRQALRLRRRIAIVPVLVQRASMPNAEDLPGELSELAYCQAANVRIDPDFHRDMDLLIRDLERILLTKPSKPNPPKKSIPPHIIKLLKKFKKQYGKEPVDTFWEKYGEILLKANDPGKLIKLAIKEFGKESVIKIARETLNANILTELINFL